MYSEVAQEGPLDTGNENALERLKRFLDRELSAGDITDPGSPDQPA